MPSYSTMLVSKKNMIPAIKTAIVVGSILFLINHGKAALFDEMTTERWIMGLVTYLVPYSVHIYGQYSCPKEK